MEDGGRRRGGRGEGKNAKNSKGGRKKRRRNRSTMSTTTETENDNGTCDVKYDVDEEMMRSDKNATSSPPRRKRAVVDALIEHIEKDNEVGGNMERRYLIDVPKENINDLPDVPYNVTGGDYSVVVINTRCESDRAVDDIRAELLTGTSFSVRNRDRRDRRGDMGDGKKDNNCDIDDGDDDEVIVDDGEGTGSYQYVGMDTETRPKFHKGGTNHPPALLQIATRRTAYLFRLKFSSNRRRGGGGGGGGRDYEKNGRDDNDDDNASAMSDSLLKFLADDTIIKVGVGIHNDVHELERAYGMGYFGTRSSYLDIGTLAKIRYPELRRLGLRNTTASVLGYKLSKAQQMKNWEMERLTDAMIKYAASDAFVALDLLDAIINSVHSLPWDPIILL